MAENIDRSYAANALRAALDMHPGITEKRMFGGDFFMLNGNMLCGIGKYGFMFRVGVDNEAEALSRPGATRVNMARKMPGFIHVDPDAALEHGLQSWIDLTINYVGPMPIKQKA